MFGPCIISVELESLGRRKASTVSALMHELNETVTARFVEESPETIIKSSPAFFGQFTMVIATQVICTAFTVCPSVLTVG